MSLYEQITGNKPTKEEKFTTPSWFVGSSNTQKKKKKNDWLKQSEALQDGYDFGDIAKTILGTAGDIGTNIAKGFLSTVEGTVDTARYGISDIYELFGNDKKANKLRENAKMDVTGALLGETNDLFNKNWSSKLDNNSVIGNKLDSVNQGIGNVGAFVGLGYLTGGTSTGSFLNSFTSAYGNARTQAYNSGENDNNSRTAGLINGFAEAISEQIFEGIPGMKVEGWGSDLVGKVGNSVKKYFGTTTGKLVSKVLNASGEGFEEIISNMLVATGNDIANSISKDYTYGMENQTGNIFKDIVNQSFFNNQDSRDAFISAMLTSAITGGASNLITNTQKNQIINEYAKQNDMSVKEVKKQFNELVSKQVNIQQPTDVNQQMQLEKETTKNLTKQLKNNNKLNLEELIKITPNNQNEVKFTLNNNEIKNISKNDEELANSLSSSGFNNTEKSHNLYNIAKSLQNNNKSAKIRFISNENLAEMGINIDTTQKTVNGFKKGDTIYININGRNAFETTIGHEIGEAIKSADNNSYTELKNLVKQVFGEQDLSSYQESYTAEDGTMLTDNVEDEWVNDKLGELFENENLRNRIADNRTLLQKVIDNIKSIVNKVTGKDQQKLKTLQQQLEDKFVELYKNTDFSGNNDDTALSLIDVNKANLNENQQNRVKLANEYKQMGLNPNTIWLKTGVNINKNSIYVNDIKPKPNIKISQLIENKTYNISDVFEGELLNNYPELKNKKLKILNFVEDAKSERITNLNSLKALESVYGGVSNTGDLYINSLTKDKIDLEDIVNSHEFQHMIQYIEGRQTKTNYIDDNLSQNDIDTKRKYRNSDDEIEAEINRVFGKMNKTQKHKIPYDYVEKAVNDYYKNNIKALNPEKIIKQIESKMWYDNIGDINVERTGNIVGREEINRQANNDSSSSSVLESRKAETLDKLYKSNEKYYTKNDNGKSRRNINDRDVDNTSFSLQQQLENNLSKQIEQYNRDYDTLSNEFRDYAQYELNKSLNEVTDNDIRDFIERAYNDMDAPDNNDNGFMNQTEINRAVKIIKDSLNQDIKYSLTDNQEDRIAKLQDEYNQWDKTREITFNERDNLRKELNDLIRSEEYKNAESKFMDMVRSGMNPDEISRTNEYQLMVREEQIRKQLKEYDDDIKVMTDDMTRISEMIENEEKSHRNPEKAIKEAKVFFGTTKDFREAAYLLQDGTMLDFSGRTQGSNTYGRRTLDHREINEVGYDMGEFIELGNIRMKPEASGFELSKPLTAKQKSVLRDYLETLNDDIIIDITKNEQVLYDSAKYRNGTSPSKIFSDLDYYFENGKFPAKSELADFYYSLTKNEDIAPVNYNPDLTYSRDVELAPIRQDISNLTEQVKNLSNQLQTNQNRTDIAPIRSDNEYNMMKDENYWKSLESTIDNTSELNTKTAKKLAKNMTKELGLKQKQQKDLLPIIQESFDNGYSLQQIINKLEEQFGHDSVVVKNDEVIDAQNQIKKYKIKVSQDIQKNIADYGYWKNKHYGKIKFSNDGDIVENVYAQLTEINPAMFPSNIINETDQLLRIAEVSDMDKKYSVDYELPIETIYDAANYIRDTFDEVLYANAIKSQNDLEENAMQYNEKSKEIPIKKMTRKEVRKFLQNGMGITKDDLAIGNDIKSFDYQLTTPERVNEKVFGTEVGRKINDETVNFARHQEAERIRFLNKERTAIKELGIKARSKESALVQQYGEGLLDDVQLAQQVSDKTTQEKIKKAAKYLRNKYDEYLDQINVELVDMGYDPIPKRKDYMRHFQELTDKFSQAGIPFNRQDLNSENLPTDINGLTEFNVPGKNWFASAQKRTGDKTTYDAITGIDGYLEGASNLIYHTQTIQRYRALENLVRSTFGQKNGLDEFNGDLSSEEAQQRVQDIQDGKLSNYAAWIHEQANSIAGKKSALDRGFERLLGRKAYTFANTLKSQVGSNMTGFNVRSALTNFISTTIAASKTNKMAMIKGTIDTIQNIFHQDDFINRSDFLTSRLKNDSSLSKKSWQKVASAGQIFMSGSDWFTSNIIVRSKYYEGISKGMTETQAMNYANDFGARVMGDRSKGSTAEIFNSKALGILTQFQLETNNQWQYMIHDSNVEYNQNLKENSGLKAGATVLFQMGQLAAYSYFFNELFEKLTGNRAAFDIVDILKKLFGIGDDDDKDFEERMKEATNEMLDSIPFGNLISGGGRLPIAEALPVKELISGEDKYGNDKSRLETLKETIPYYVLPTGYGQIKKTAGGLEMYNEDLSTPGSYTDSGNLRFTAEKDTGSIIKNGLFGKWSSKEAQEYIDSGYKTINANRIQEMIDLGMNSTEYRNYRNGLAESGTKNADKIDYINNLDIPINQKNIMASNVLNRNINMENYNNYDNYEEFDYAYKNPDKYNMMSAIKSYNDFNTYKTKIDDIREKYSTNNGYSTEQRKSKVISYVNSLDLNIPQKAMMIRQYYSSFNNYNNEIVNYVGSLDYTYDEKVGILEQLGMKVDSNGNVTW